MGKHTVKAGECARFFVKLSGGKEGHYIGAGVHPMDSSPLIWNHKTCWVVDVNDGEVCLAGDENSDNEQVRCLRPKWWPINKLIWTPRALSHWGRFGLVAWLRGSFGASWRGFAT